MEDNIIHFHDFAASGKLRLISDILRKHNVSFGAVRTAVMENCEHPELRSGLPLHNRFSALAEPYVADDTASLGQEIPFPSSSSKPLREGLHGFRKIKPPSSVLKSILGISNARNLPAGHPADSKDSTPPRKEPLRTNLSQSTLSDNPRKPQAGHPSGSKDSIPSRKEPLRTNPSQSTFSDNPMRSASASTLEVHETSAAFEPQRQSN